MKTTFDKNIMESLAHCLKLYCAIFGGLLIASAMFMSAGHVEAQPTLQNNSVPEKSADLAFVNVNVVPMDQERILENYTVLIEGNLITWVGPENSIELPAALQKIDGTGKYLMPGLVYSHHIPAKSELICRRSNSL